MTNTIAQQPSTVIFDLDGTLVDSANDIIECIQATLHSTGIEPVNKMTRYHIGPPLADIFTTLAPSMRPEQVDNAIRLFRERYRASGFPMTTIYPGVEELLVRLQRYSIPCLIATNKPRQLTEMILELKGLRSYFVDWQCIGDYGLTSKAELISMLMQRNQTPTANTWVIGDGISDIQSAHKLGLCSIAHLGGYGAKDELINCKPGFTVESMRDVIRLFSWECV